MRPVWAAAWIVVRFFGTFVWRVRSHGTENVPKSGGVILAANHQSLLDPPFVGGCLPRETTFMARRSLFEIPLLGRLIVALNAFPIERNSGDVKGVRSAIVRLKRGEALLVFPEGTRTRDGEIGPMKAGLRLIAERADVPIVPVLIRGAYEVWPRKRLLPRPWGRVDVYFGKPVRLSGDDAEFGATLRDAVRGLEPRRRSADPEEG